MSYISLKDKQVFITGASSGIGRALSRAFAEQSAGLVLAALDQEKEVLESWAEELDES
ncbi:MAG: SDR family NAD(P)-dependent oxidoreductase, partial [Desulfosudaceae bacterium]